MFDVLAFACAQVTVAQHSDSTSFPVKLVDEWQNVCTSLPACSLTVQPSQMQPEATDTPTTRKRPRAPPAPVGFKLATAKLTAGQGTDHFSNMTAAVGEYSVTFQTVHAGRTLTTAQPLSVVVTKSALPGSVSWLLAEELDQDMTQADELRPIPVSWPPLHQSGVPLPERMQQLHPVIIISAPDSCCLQHGSCGHMCMCLCLCMCLCPYACACTHFCVCFHADTGQLKGCSCSRMCTTHALMMRLHLTFLQGAPQVAPSLLTAATGMQVPWYS